MEIDIEREIAALDERMARAGERAEQRVASLGKLSGTASSPDGTITVEVEPGGLLSDLRLSPAALAQGSDSLARNITALVDKATKRAGGALHKALAPTMSPEAVREIESLGYVPYEDDEEDFDPDYSSNPFGGRIR
ncbi:YbaB/EbfC DNA-binding family protein [Herbihabitans rhizosphaerae]|uniref:YbaB/EbfC DNA-binding family protein n=1 Tax=Herbihabitans rhizosphaerae TaxID=1872711 RepID=A0A4Q7KKU8_9PSEU|nr:YbaB/EbfC family nucleoid-associated protein [Herbihabitans rhizosphaerae]RZS36846.1 YbaB/EbfC DNA-binding family protein [Herbihabitans rhizosphaerae]